MLPRNNHDILPTSLEDGSYMNRAQLEYFKQKLLSCKEELENELYIIKQYLQQEEKNEADLYDRISREINIARELSNKERYRQLIYKINQALESIEWGAYGYCVETGEPIGIECLEVQPFATFSIEAQKKREKYSKSNGLLKLGWPWA